MMDELLADEREEDREGRAYQRRPWPERSAEEGGGPTVSGRTVTGQGFTAQCEHPLHDARAALTVPHLAPIMSQLLRCSDTESELCLIHQNFRRTDPSPGPHPPCIGEGRLDGTQASFHVRSPRLCSRLSTPPPPGLTPAGPSPLPPASSPHRPLHPVPLCKAVAYATENEGDQEDLHRAPDRKSVAR